MRLLKMTALRLRSLTRRGQVERELADEFAFHFERQIQENLERGMPYLEARAAAFLSIGTIGRFQEECRDKRGVNYIEDALSDVRYAIRGFAKNRGFAALAIFTLALGIGASTAIFSLVSTIALRPLPVSDPERLAVLWEDASAAGLPRDTPAPANFADWRAQNSTFEDMAAVGWQAYNLTGAGEPERLIGLRVTPNLFTVLGIQPAAGRFLLPSDGNPESPRVAVISHALWQRHFGRDRGAIGKVITLNGQAHTIVGVTPAGFQFPSKGAEIWVPPAFTPSQRVQRNAHYLIVFGRLKRGVSFTQAQADMTTIGRRLERQYPEGNKNIGVAVVPVREYYAGDLRLALRVLFAAVGALLLIACANLAHLLLARGAARSREVAVRVALGAGRARVARQLLTECLVLALSSAALGAVLSRGAFRFLARLIPDSFPAGTALHLDLPVLAFTSGIAVLTAVLFGAGPAVQAFRLDLNHALKQGAGKGSVRGDWGRSRGALVAAEVALTTVLLIAAGLLLNSYFRIRNVDPGFRPEKLLALETPLPPAKYGNPARRAEFYRQVIEQAEALPGVLSAGYVNFLPLTLKGGSSGFVIDGRPRPEPGHWQDATNRAASAHYLRTLGVPLVRGRLYDERDGPGAPRVVVINQTMARTYWPAEDALGARIRFGDGGPSQPSYTVIGIVGDVKQMGLDAPAHAEMYFPVTQVSPGGSFFWPGTLVVRAAGDPRSLAAALRRIVSAVDPDQPVADVNTMDDVVDKELSSRQIQTTVLSAFAVTALLLAAVGLYGVLSYVVVQRTAEIGLRIALGARPGEVIRAVMGQALRWTALGLVLGLAAAYAVTRSFAALLFRVSPSDPRTFAAVGFLLLCVAALAGFVPGRRAARVDPISALKHE